MTTLYWRMFDGESPQTRMPHKNDCPALQKCDAVGEALLCLRFEAVDLRERERVFDKISIAVLLYPA